MKIDEVSSSDSRHIPSLEADINAQSLRFVFAFQGSGQIRIEGSREEVTLRRVTDTFPFELTGGRVPGKTWIWRGTLDYRVAQFIQATLNYEGRAEGSRGTVHTARAEVRVFF